MFLGLSAINMIFVLVLENTANQITVSSISSALIGRFCHTEFKTHTNKFDNRKTISLAVLIQMYSYHIFKLPVYITLFYLTGRAELTFKFT